MNLILFERSETSRPLPRTDPRAIHVERVLRRQPGEPFDVGLVDGPRGHAAITAATPEALELSFAWDAAVPPDLPPITLIIGLPRPQTARDILRDATSLGVAAMHFVATERSESSYAASTLWAAAEWRRLVVAGAEQAFSTRLPAVSHGQALADALRAAPAAAVRIALDNYESPERLGASRIAPADAVVLAIGAERGWSARERDAFRAQRFTFCHLGERVLRTEAAVTAAVAIVRAKLGLM